MPFKIVSQKGFLKGVFSSTDRFNLQKGSVQRSSNFLLTNRGALTVCDGTFALSSDTSGTNPGSPIQEIGLYVDPVGSTATPLMAAPNGANMGIYTWSLTPGGAFTILTLLPLTPNWDMPQFVNFQASALPAVIIALGNDRPIVKYQGASGFSNLTFNNTGPGGSPDWQANHYYTVGDRIGAPDANTATTGKNATWQVVNVVIGSGSNTMSNTSGIGGGGLSGGTRPNFANSNSAVKGTGETVTDNQIIWMDLKENVDLAKQFPPHGAQHIIKHANALWAWNTAPTTTIANGSIDGPSVLRMSAPNDADQWPLVNTTLIGQDDGTQGTGLATFTIAEAGITPSGTLVVFKDFSTYTVTGVFQAQDFAVNQVKTDMGCLAPRSIAFATGMGVFRFCHLGFAMFDGINDHGISEPIRNYVYGDKVTPGVDFRRLSKMRGTLVTNPPLYICSAPTVDGNTTRIFAFDLTQKAWMVIDYVNANPNYQITCMAQMRPPAAYVATLPPSAVPEGAATVIADIGPGNATAIRRWQEGDTTWDATSPPTPVTWSFRPPEVGEPGSRAYFRRANLRLTAPSPGQITGFFNIGDESQPNNVQQEGGAGPSSGTSPSLSTTANYYGNEDLGVALDVHQTGPSLNGTYSGSGPANIEGVDYHINAKNPRPFGQRF
jgi:hypothetical protein